MDEPVVKTGHVYPAGYSVFQGTEDEAVYRERNAMLVEALRSGRFIQAQGMLEAVRSNGYRTEVTGHCCLGVACRVAEQEAVGFWIVTRVTGSQTVFGTITHGDDGDLVLSAMAGGYPPDLVKEWFGWESTNPYLYYLHSDGDEGGNHAAYLNDSAGMPFDRIADAFERTFVTYTYRSYRSVDDLTCTCQRDAEEHTETGITDLPE